MESPMILRNQFPLKSCHDFLMNMFMFFFPKHFKKREFLSQAQQMRNIY